METTTIAIIDDHKIVRQGLRELLHKIGKYEVIHEFESGNDFIDALPLDPEPQVCILDYSMPDKNGVDILKTLEARSENYRVLLLTQHFEEPIINDAYRYGARGFLHKNCTASELKTAIDSIVTIGYTNVSEILKRMRRYDEAPREKREAITLSDRERTFLTLVCDPRELTYDQMADIMGVSVKSIESYRTALFERYHIKSKVGLVLFSFNHQLTPPFI